MSSVERGYWCEMYPGARVWNPAVDRWVRLEAKRPDGWWIYHFDDEPDGEAFALPPMPDDYEIRIQQPVLSMEAYHAAIELVRQNLGAEVIIEPLAARRSPALYFVRPVPTEASPITVAQFAGHLHMMHRVPNIDMKGKQYAFRMAEMATEHDAQHARWRLPVEAIPHEHRRAPE